MNEQGIAWIVAGSQHDPSPEELRSREHRRALSDSQPSRSALRERVTALIGGQATSLRVGTLATGCCAA